MLRSLYIMRAIAKDMPKKKADNEERRERWWGRNGEGEEDGRTVASHLICSGLKSPLLIYSSLEIEKFYLYLYLKNPF